MLEEFNSKLKNISDRELQRLEKELEYYSETEQRLIVSELKLRKEKELQNIQKKNSIYSSKVELATVLIIGFGLYSIISTLNYLDISSTKNFQISNLSIYFNSLYQIISLIIIFTILKLRRWKLSDFNLGFKFKMFFIAILLVIINNLIIWGAIELFNFEKLYEFPQNRFNNTIVNVNWISIGFVIILNSFFEEFILIGYLFKRLEKYSPVIIIGISMLIRLSYHTYQGMIALITIPVIALVFGIYYWKFKKLWPLIIAHGMTNLLFLLRTNSQE